MRLGRPILHSLALIGAGSLLMAARQEAAPLPDFLVPELSAQPLRKAFDAKPGDELLRGRIVRAAVVHIAAPAKVSLDRFSQSFEGHESLTPVMLRADRKGAIRMIFCGTDQRAISKLAGALIGDIGSKFEQTVRFCFQDEDKDGKFESFVLGGAKDPKFQTPVAIEPVPYSLAEMVPYAGESELVLRYRKFDPESRKIILELKMRVDGKDQAFDFIRTMPNGTMQTDYPTVKTNPNKIPYPMHFPNIAGAEIGINGVDANGVASMQVNRPFAASLIKPVEIRTQVIYVYVYR
jgi:hypothetical protein